MNFGQNLYNWFPIKRSITGALAIVVISLVSWLQA